MNLEDLDGSWFETQEIWSSLMQYIIFIYDYDLMCKVSTFWHGKMCVKNQASYIVGISIILDWSLWGLCHLQSKYDSICVLSLTFQHEKKCFRDPLSSMVDLDEVDGSWIWGCWKFFTWDVNNRVLIRALSYLDVTISLWDKKCITNLSSSLVNLDDVNSSWQETWRIGYFSKL